MMGCLALAWLLAACAPACASSRDGRLERQQRQQQRLERQQERQRAQRGDGSDEASLSSRYCTSVRRSRDVIVYLGQTTHSSYDATHKNTLNASMESLRHNMLRIADADVIVWHEGDLEPADATALDGAANVRFCLLTEETGWGSPPWLPVMPENKFSAGYRYMIRFYAVTIWRTLRRLGYEWVMRMDDDSFVLSPVAYNVFDDMRDAGLLYGYRVVSRECPTIFGDFVEGFAAHSDARVVGDAPKRRRRLLALRNATAPRRRAEGIEELDEESKHVIKFCGTWPRHCRKASMREALSAALRKANLGAGDAPGGLELQRDVESAVSKNEAMALYGSKRPANWYCNGPGRLGYYNNWFVTKIDWWLDEPAVRRMIAAFDRSNLIFTRRCNDLIFQTAAIKLFLPLAKRKRYTDFTYQHHTIYEGRVTFGGIETGTADAAASENLEAYLSRHIPDPKQRLKVDVDTCLVQATEGGPLEEIKYISPAKARSKGEADTSTHNVAVARFESPYCSADLRTYLT